MSARVTVRPGEVIGAGFFVLSRDPDTGRIDVPGVIAPFEYPDFDTAADAAEAAAQARPGTAYTLLASAGEWRVLIEDGSDDSMGSMGRGDA